MDSYQLRPFTHERLEEVELEWKSVSGIEEFEIESRALFDWCAEHVVKTPGDGQALELFNETRGEAEAILEVIDGRRGSLSKLLKVYSSPNFWDADSSQDGRQRLAFLYAAAYGEVIKAANANGANEVRIYGRTNAMLDLLKAITKRWDSHQTGWTATMQGRWLSLARSK